MYFNCNRCSGRKEFFVKSLGMFVKCESCEKNCTITIPDEKEICPKCNGEGKRYQVTSFGALSTICCKKCHSTGFVEKKIIKRKEKKNV